MDNGEGPFKFARGRAALDVWLGMIGAMMYLRKAREKDLYLLVAGNTSSQTECDCPD